MFFVINSMIEPNFLVSFKSFLKSYFGQKVVLWSLSARFSNWKVNPCIYCFQLLNKIFILWKPRLIPQNEIKKTFRTSKNDDFILYYYYWKYS